MARPQCDTPLVKKDNTKVTPLVRRPHLGGYYLGLLLHKGKLTLVVVLL